MRTFFGVVQEELRRGRGRLLLDIEGQGRERLELGLGVGGRVRELAVGNLRVGRAVENLSARDPVSLGAGVHADGVREARGAIGTVLEIGRREVDEGVVLEVISTLAVLSSRLLNTATSV